MTIFKIAIYSKYKTKKLINEAMKKPDFAENPLLDLKHPFGGYGTPNEIKSVTGETTIYVNNLGFFSWNKTKGKWKFTEE